MLKSIKNIKVKVLLLISTFVLLSCIYNAFCEHYADHHCDHPEHCSICIILQALHNDVPTPLGAILNKTYLLFLVSAFVYLVNTKIDFLKKDTLVSFCVKKTE